MTQPKKFRPGYYLQQDLDALKLFPKEFSQRSGISEEQVLGILKGNIPLDPSLADKLSASFRVPLRCGWGFKRITKPIRDDGIAV